MLRRVNIGIRLGLILGGAVLALVVVGAVAINRLADLDGEVDALARERVPALVAVNEVEVAFMTMRVYTTYMLSAQDETEMASNTAAFMEALDEKNAAMARLEEMIETPEARTQFDVIRADVAEYQALAEEFRELIGAFEISSAINFMEEQLRPVASHVADDIEKLVNLQIQRI